MTDPKLLPDTTTFGKDESNPHRLYLQRVPSQSPSEGGESPAKKLCKDFALLICPHLQEVGIYDFTTGTYHFPGFGILAKNTEGAAKVHFHPPPDASVPLGQCDAICHCR